MLETALRMRVFVRCKVLCRHCRGGGEPTWDSVIELAQIFNLVFHGVILAKARLLQQRIVVLSLLATGMSSTAATLCIIRCVRVAVVAVAGGVTRPAVS